MALFFTADVNILGHDTPRTLVFRPDELDWTWEDRSLNSSEFPPGYVLRAEHWGMDEWFPDEEVRDVALVNTHGGWVLAGWVLMNVIYSLPDADTLDSVWPEITCTLKSV